MFSTCAWEKKCLYCTICSHISIDRRDLLNLSKVGMVVRIPVLDEEEGKEGDEQASLRFENSE